MRLLRVRKEEAGIVLTFEEFLGSDIPRYGILSHTWAEEEVSYDDFVAGRGPAMKGYAKILGCSEEAVKHDLDYIWVDTCCIDKRSSAELTEAINAMYKWYENAAICFAYLADVPMKQWEQSRWFSRGWTLQELVAPEVVNFYDANWSLISTKAESQSLLSEATGIPLKVLAGDVIISGLSARARMAWAVDRTTTRTEDMAYCLMGLFNVNMPLLYGEGSRAFGRLQEEIARQCADQSLLAWTSNSGGLYANPLAPSPSCFSHEETDVRTMTSQTSLSSLGLTTEVRLVRHPTEHGLYRAVLTCGTAKFNKYCAILLVQVDASIDGIHYEPKRYLRTRPDILEWVPKAEVAKVQRQTILIMKSDFMPVGRRDPERKLLWTLNSTAIEHNYVRPDSKMIEPIGFVAFLATTRPGKVAAFSLKHKRKRKAAVLVVGLSAFGIPWIKLLDGVDPEATFNEFDDECSVDLKSSGKSAGFTAEVVLLECRSRPLFHTAVRPR